MPSLGEGALYAYGRYFPVRRGKMRILNALYGRVVPPDDTIRIARLKFGTFTMRCDLRQFLQRQFYFFGTYLDEADILESWCEFARNAPIVFDVGANAGIFSLAALAARPSGIVHAFEPTHEIAAQLRQTVQSNHLTALSVHEVAIGRNEGTAYLHFCKGDKGDNDGMNFVTESEESGATMPIPVTTLDAFCNKEKISRIDLLKLDIQGNEAEALLGAQRLLEEGRIGVVFTELNWAEKPALRCPASESVGLLYKHGFLFAEPKKPLSFRSPGSWMRSLSEIIAIRQL
jgi:FkbM family methyltransferase